MTNQQDTRPTMEPPPRGVLLAVSWAYAITTALEDRLTSGGVYAQVTPDEFRRHIDRLLGHYEDALKGAAR